MSFRLPRLLGFFVALTMLSGALTPVTAQVPDFFRDAAPFAVTDADGTPYEHPFTGGFNSPAPQFIDIDADGDLDLFVQEHFNQLMFFKNIGTPEAPRFFFRGEAYTDLDVGEWYRFADLDADGDYDLLAEEVFGYIRYYRNEGTPQEASFVLAADTLKDAAGEPIVAERQNIPTVGDVDCNDQLDLFLGRQNGTITRYEMEGLTSEGLPNFAFRGDRYQDIEVIGEGAATGGASRKGGTVHGANALTLADIDADGDVDLLWGDFFEESVIAFQNQATCESPAFAEAEQDFILEPAFTSSGFNATNLADIDADGDLDLFIGVQGGAFSSTANITDNFYFFESDGAGTFTERTSQFLYSLDVGNESVPAFADADGDGDLDLFVGNRINEQVPNTADLVYFENTGSAAAPSFANRGKVSGIQANFNFAPALGDLDADGDADLLLGNFVGDVAYYRNDGGLSFSLIDNELVDVSSSYATPTLIDVDEDGDLDLFVGKSNGEVAYYRNDGSASAPAFTLQAGAYAGIDVGQRSVPAFSDVDEDGDPDLLVGSATEGVVYFRNDGAPGSPSFVESTELTLTVPANAAPAVADLDGDGDVDVFAGSVSGGLAYYANLRVGASVETDELPGGVRLSAAYPNPFRQSTTLSFRLAAPQHVRLAVYDVLGREVAVLQDAMAPAGAQEVTLEAGALPAGVYLYRLEAGGTVQTGTVLRIK